MDARTAFESLRKTQLPSILSLLDEVVADSSPNGSTVAEMCGYHLRGGGKRLRALLPLLVAESLGRSGEELVPFGAACEMLHNATLVHDDLQDGDRMRRGRPTVWSRYGAAPAINAGDAMFYYAVLLLQRLSVPAEQRDRAIRRLLLDTLCVIEGQERELALKEHGSPTVEAYLSMVEGKTSGLFSLPMAGAAELCGEPDEVVSGLAEAARHLGVIFQIQDDVLDLYGDKGRGSLGSDIGEGKRSFLVVHALRVASDEEAGWLREVLDKPRQDTSDHDVTRAAELFRRVGSLKLALAEISARRERARQVSGLRERDGLRRLIDGLADLFVEPIAHLLTPAPEAGQDPERDRERCASLLPRVSRTFALSIETLPKELRPAVRVAYLLCRLVDSIEDEPDLGRTVRGQLFDIFEGVVGGGVDAGDLEARLVAASVGADGADGDLCRHASAVVRQLRGLPLPQQQAIVPRVLEMTRGMREYSARVDDRGELRITDLDDLERYCYFVAGTVGQLLTDLFLDYVHDVSPAQKRELEARAVSFGVGLQLVNILKDVADDARRGVCYLPETLAQQHGVDLDRLLDPEQRAGALALVRALVAHARVQLERAAEYSVAWPLPAGEPVRLFCAVPLLLAQATLDLIERGDETLRPDTVPKVSRAELRRILSDAGGCVRSDEALRQLLWGRS